MKSYKLGEMVYFVNSYTVFPLVLKGRIVTIRYPRNSTDLLHEEDPDYDIFEEDNFASDLTKCHKAGHLKIFSISSAAYRSIKRHIEIEKERQLKFIDEIEAKELQTL